MISSERKMVISRFASGIMALLMLCSLIPMVSSAIEGNDTVDRYTFIFSDGEKDVDVPENVRVVLTDLADASNNISGNIIDGKAVFENLVQAGKKYTVNVSSILGYENVKSFEITVGEENEQKIVLTPIEKLEFDGTIYDENGEPYAKGVTINIDGYEKNTVDVDSNGKYSFMLYKGKDYRINVKANEEKYNEITTEVASVSNETNIQDFQLTVKQFQIKTSVNDNSMGTVSDTVIVNYGGTSEVVANAKNGYFIEAFNVDDKNQIPKEEIYREYTYKFEDVQANHKVDVIYKRKQYKVSISVKKNGSVSYKTNDGEGLNEIKENVNVTINESTDETKPATITLKAEPDKGYRVSSVSINSILEEFSKNDWIYNETLTMIKDYSFEVTFSLNDYDINVSNINKDGGDIYINGEKVDEKIKVGYGSKATIEIKPNEGYQIKSFKVGDEEAEFTGADFDEVYTYEIKDIQENKNVTIEFEKIKNIKVNDQIDNDYYKLVCTKDGKEFTPILKETNDGLDYIVPKDSSVFVKPKEPYTKYSFNNPSNNINKSINNNTTLTSIYLKSGDKSFYGWKVIDDLKINIKFDVTNPEMSNVKKIPMTDFSNVKFEVTANVTDDLSGVDKVYYSTSESFENPLLANYDSSNNTVSFYTIDSEYNGKYYIKAVDKALNESDIQAVDIAIDITSPKIDKFEFSNNSKNINACEFGTYSNEDVKVVITASDKESKTTNSGVKSISFNGEEKAVDQNNTVTFTLKAKDFAQGKEVDAKAIDNAGNESIITIPSSENSNIINNKIIISKDKSDTIIKRNNDPVYENNGECWYAGDTDFIVDISDVIGLKSVVIKMNGKEVVNEILDKSSTSITSKEYKINTSENSLDGENVITVEVVNVSNNTSTSRQTVFIDTTAPDIVNFQINKIGGGTLDKVLNYLTFGNFFNEQIEVTVTAADEKASSGINSITLFADGKELETQDVVDNKATFVIPAGKLTNGKNYFDKVISAKATDNVKNITKDAVEPTTVNSDIKNSGLMVETVKPEVSVHYSDAVKNKNENTATNGDWYASNVEFTINAKDKDSGLRKVLITINGESLVNENLYDKELHTVTYKVNTENADIAEDGSYTLKVQVVDNAGNVDNTYTTTVYKDIDKPYITGFDFAPKKYIEGSEEETSIQVTDYGFYFKADTKVTVSSRDDIPTSGIESITYYTVDKNKGKSNEKTVNVDSEGKIKFDIPANFKGQIYARATDNVSNVQAKFVNPNSTIVEDKDKHNEENHIHFSKKKTDFKTSDNVELYATDVPVTITVTDTYSGIREIEWSVVAPYDKQNNQNGRVTINNDSKISQDSDSGWKRTKYDSNLVTKMEKTINVKNNSNDIVVNVKMTDRAGNISSKKIKFSIDKTNPVIDIKYDNNTPDETYKDIYKENRVATITVTERNFNEDDIKHKITNTDGVIPDLSAWTEHKDSTNPDKSYYTSTVLYSFDGDYTFDIEYVDLAKNPSNKIEQHKFTIDKTMPIVTVTYDNNNYLNGNYYNKDRVATITVVEHNFDYSRFIVKGVAADNGNAMSFPMESSWVDNGNTHVAKISYSSDAKYRFDFEFKDMAGNSCADYTPEEFYIDKTAPSLEISGVEDKSANKNEVAPVISYSDTNFNVNDVKIELSGVNNGKVDYKNTVDSKSIKNGQVVSYDNFEKIKKVDDIYTLTVTLTDFAGNKTKKSIQFSANRFGSVYTFDLTLDEIKDKYINTERDIVFTETNVDKLVDKSINIKLVKNGTPTDLKSGSDFKIEETGGNGKWSKYKYTINKSLFTGDGRYSINIYSKDKAGNENENIEESKKAEISFGVDKTKPVIVPVDFESEKQYPVEVKTVEAEIKDNLVLDGVKIYLGKEDSKNEIKYTSKEEKYKFDIPQANKTQSVIFVATDAAGNKQKVSVKNFLVSTNIFVRWYNNKPLFIGSIIGVVVITMGISALIIFKKKNDEDE